MKKLIFSVVLIFCNVGLAYYEEEYKERKVDYCKRIYERMYIPLAYQCERLDLERFYELQCYNEIVKTIEKMIVYCIKQESFNGHLERFF